MALWVGKWGRAQLGDWSLCLGYANSCVWSQLPDLLGPVGLIWNSIGMTHFCSFILSFSKLLAWIYSYGGGRVLRTTRERGQTLMCKHFLSLFIFLVCHLSCWPKQVIWPSPESVWEETGHVNIWVCYHYNPPLRFCKPTSVPVQARKDMEEGISSGVALFVHLAYLRALRCILGVTVVPDCTRKWRDISGTTHSQVVPFTLPCSALESEGGTCQR